MNEKVKKALNEGRLKFFDNGRYSYKPSKEYLTKFGKKSISSSEIKILRDSVKKLDNLSHAFIVAEERNKKVSHVSNGKIILV
jgi:hypothetical protein